MAPDRLILYVSKYDPQRHFYTMGMDHEGYRTLTSDSVEGAILTLERENPHGIDLLIMGSRNLENADTLADYVVSMGDDAPPVMILTGQPLDSDRLYDDKPEFMEKHVKLVMNKPPIKRGREVISAIRGIIGPP